jgi:HlyD family secretion protein
MRIWVRRTVWVLLLGLGAAGLLWFAWPPPVRVDLAVAARGPMEVTVDDEGKTRVRHIYTVSSPIAGKVLRTSREVGDRVTADETVVAVMQPSSPSFHDVRTHEELQAAATAAEAAVRLAEAEVRRIEAALAFSRTELRRAQALARTDAISLKALDKAKLDVETNEAALASAKAQLDVRRSERASVAARLIHPSGNESPQPDPACCVQIRAPVSGRVLKIVQESEAVVPAGAPLIEIGDPADLEVVADLLSTDAVRIKAGANVKIDGWGGPPVRGRVNRIDPAGFLKVSALGIEEQRVRTRIDFVDAGETWARLGHDYRVIVHVTVWAMQDVLTVPIGALFRKGETWAVFAVVNGRVRTAPIEVGQRNNRSAEVVSGLSAGDRVVLHPSDRVKDGAAVAERETR